MSSPKMLAMKGHISEDQATRRPYIHLHVNAQRVKMVMSVGSPMSLVNRAVYEQLGKPTLIPAPACDIPLIGMGRDWTIANAMNDSETMTNVLVAESKDVANVLGGKEINALNMQVVMDRGYWHVIAPAAGGGDKQ